MRRTRPLRATLLATAGALALTGCGADETQDAGPRTGSSSAAGSGSVAGTPSASPGVGSAPGPSAPAAGTPAPACTVQPGVLPDGTWAGPITMDVDGRGGSSAFASSQGRGTLRVAVDDGKVTSGTWTVQWRSRGSARTPQAAATLALRGRIEGSVRGPARAPVLEGTWSLDGEVHLTRPVDQRAPVAETGTDVETLTVTGASCTRVTGTFLPSFTSKEAAATFSGRAAWVGRPVA